MTISDKKILDAIIKDALKFYSTLETLSPAFREEINKVPYLVKLQDGDTLLEDGEICHAFYFVGKGALIAENKKDLKKITTWLCKAGGSCTSISGMYGVKPTEERIYALGETYVMAVDNKDILVWYDKFPEFIRIMRKMFEYYLQSAQERASMVRMGTARQKYAYFKKAYPGYSDVITIDIIACFLGMKTSTLAFIIKEEEKQLGRASNIDDTYKLLIKYIDSHKSFLQASITLKQLAGELQISPHTLSEVINKKSGKNFNDFINSYRIAYIQERFKNPENWKHITLEALGAEAGFKSRSSFFAVFKKHVGVSPSVYINSVLSLR